MTPEQKQQLANGELQLKFDRYDEASIKRIKNLLTEVFPSDPTTSVIGGKTTYIAAFKRGMWKCSEKSFNLITLMYE